MQVMVNISHRQYEKTKRLAQQRRQDISAVAEEKTAYLRLHPQLLQEHAGEHVAIYKGEVVDHDIDGVALSRRVYAQYPDSFVWITAVGEKPLPELRSRLFRWADGYPYAFTTQLSNSGPVRKPEAAPVVPIL